MHVRRITLLQDDREISFSRQDTRETLIAELGQPQDTNIPTRRGRRPSIFKYGETEFHFDGDHLSLIYRESQHGVIELCASLDKEG